MTHARRIDVQTFLNEQPFSPFQWLVFGLCFVIVLLDGFDTAAIGYIAPSLIKDWGVSRPALAPVLSAALFGLAGGALVAGPLADRFGRKRVLVVSVALFAVACGASALAFDLTQLTVLRCITGIGLGAAMPNAVTMMSEYCPDQRRATLTNLMFCGFPLGAAFGGFLAAWMIPQFGWRSVLVLGGVAPLLVLVLLVLVLPESVRYLVHHNRPVEQIRRVMLRISAVAAEASAFVLTEKAPETQAHSGVGVVLSRPYLVGTLMLWVAYFMGLMIFYALINWMPVLFKDGGLPPQQATLIAALFPLGGVGAVAFGWLMDRFNADRIIAIGFGLTALAIYAIGQAVGNLGTLVLAVFVAGILMNTAQSSLPSLAAAYYPTKGRATGVSWMLGIGRFGGIAGSFMVGEMSRRQMGMGEIFLALAVPGALACLALLVKLAVNPNRAAAVRGAALSH